MLVPQQPTGEPELPAPCQHGLTGSQEPGSPWHPSSLAARAPRASMVPESGIVCWAHSGSLATHLAGCHRQPGTEVEDSQPVWLPSDALLVSRESGSCSGKNSDKFFFLLQSAKHFKISKSFMERKIQLLISFSCWLRNFHQLDHLRSILCNIPIYI